MGPVHNQEANDEGVVVKDQSGNGAIRLFVDSAILVDQVISAGPVSVEGVQILVCITKPPDVVVIFVAAGGFLHAGKPGIDQGLKRILLRFSSSIVGGAPRCWNGSIGVFHFLSLLLC